MEEIWQWGGQETDATEREEEEIGRAKGGREERGRTYSSRTVWFG